MYFQLVNAWDYVYTGRSVCGIALPKSLAILDFDDLVIEIVQPKTLPPDYLSHIMNIDSQNYKFTGHLTIIDSHLVVQTFNPYVHWEQVLEGRVHRLTFYGRTIILTSTLDWATHYGNARYLLTLDGTMLMSFLCDATSKPLIQVEYAFIAGVYLIVRLSVRIAYEQMGTNGVLQIAHSKFHSMFSLVFTGADFRNFLGVYHTWNHPDFQYKLYKPLDLGLTAKLSMLLQNRY